MTHEIETLKVGTQIENYYILSVVHVSHSKIVYHAEDMKYNREVWLYEYFPEPIAKRHHKSDEQSTVYVHPTQRELFDLGKTEFHNFYTNLKTLNHPSIPLIYETFESAGTLYVSTKYNAHTTSLSHNLNDTTKIFSDQQIGMLALNIVRVFVLLQERGLQIHLLTPEILLIETPTQRPLLPYVEYKTLNKELLQNSISELGRVLYEIMQRENFQESDLLKPLEASRGYSAALCGLVNRMITNDVTKQFKTFQELQMLLKSYESTLLECEQIVCEKREDKLSNYLSLTSILLIILFGYYVFTKQTTDVKDVTWLDSARYHLAAYFGNLRGELALAQMYEKGYYVNADIEEAVFWYKKAAHKGDKDAQINLAYIYKNVAGVKDEKAAHEIFLKLANSRELYAQKTVAYNYMQGQGVTQDYQQAMHWFLKAYEQGDAYSCGAIGLMYASGNGVPKDLTKALEWFQKGVDRNDTYSKKEFAILKERLNKSTQLFQHEQSRKEYNLGYAYETGSTKSKNHKEAIKHYQQAAALGNITAEFRLAQLYERSEEFPRDDMAALFWYKKAAEHGDRVAYYRISQLYRAGHGVEKSDVLALQWCKEAADRGLGVAQGMMGSSYEFGWGTGINYTVARHWYKLAIESGYENAVGRLDGLNQKLQAKEEVVPIKRKQQVQTQRPQNNSVEVNSLNISLVNVKACLSCHGQHFEKSALGKSAIVSNMSKSEIATALKGYKYGTYGGELKVLMRGQVMKYSDNALERVSQSIGRY
jgi:TPR repeat protein